LFDYMGRRIPLMRICKSAFFNCLYVNETRTLLNYISIMKRLFTFLTVLLLLSSGSYAQKKTFIRDYIYQASEADSKLTARAVAIREMQTLLLQEIGQAIQAEQTMKKLSTARDGKETFSEDFSQKIMAITAGFVEMKILDEFWNGKTYYIEARMTVDPKEVSQRVAEVLNDKQKEKELEDAIARDREERDKQAQERLAAQRIAELEKEMARQKEIKALKTAYFINYRLSLTATYGALFGVCKRWGGYAQYSGNMFGVWEGNLEATYKENGSNGEHRYFRSSFTAGGMVRPVRSWNWFLYAGAGYGKCGATYSYGDYYYCPNLTKGMELEGGVTFSLAFLNASMGYSTITGSRFKELHFGFGVKF